MKYILKNYLKTFVKNWVQTLGTILFIMMMITIVIGMMAAPLQISTIVNEYKSKNNSYDTFISTASKIKSKNSDSVGNFSNEFLYDYVYKNQAYKGTDENGKEVEIVGQSPVEILSPVYKVSLDKYLASTGAKDGIEAQTFVGQDLNQAINAYKQGGLIPLDLQVQLTDRTANLIGPNGKPVRNLQSLTEEDFKTGAAFKGTNVETVINNLSVLLAADAKLGINQNLDNNEVQTRLMMKALTLLSNNKLDLSASDLQKLQQSLSEQAGGNMDIATTPEQTIAVGMNKALHGVFAMVITKNPINVRWTLSTFELFSPQMYKQLAWKDYSPDSKEGQLAYEDFSYDFNAYVLSQIFNNTENKNLYDKEKGKRYDFQSEKSMYFAKTTTDSLFPSFAIELKTLNDEYKVPYNQLQLEKGENPEAISFKDLTNRDRTRAETPTVVINSAYFESNKLSLNDMIQIPDSAAMNNLLLPDKLPIESFLLGNLNFKVVGTGSKFDDLVPGPKFTQFLEKIDNYANGYIDDTLFSTIRNARWNFTSNNDNSYRTKFMFKNLWSSKDHVADQLTINRLTNKSVYVENSLVDFKDSSAIKQLNVLEVMVTVFIILGIVVLILSFVFINFIIKKELNETRKQIGIFKSFGYKISELSGIFAFKTFITIFVGIVVGLVASIPLQLYCVSLYIDGVMFQFSHIYMDPIFLVMVLVVIPLVFLLLSYGLTLQYLREPTLSLLSNGAKISKWTVKPSLLVRKLSEQNKMFNYRLQKAFVNRSMGKFVVVQILFAFAALSYTLLFGAQTLLYALVGQGFSALNPATDHEFSWVNKTDVDIPLGKDKFDVDLNRYENQNFEYVSYDNKSKFGDALINNKKTSDSRYRISYLVDSYANSFSASQKEHNHALDLMMPKEFYVGKYGKKQDTPAIDLGQSAQKILLPDYYLNWIFTLKIADLDQDVVDSVRNNVSYDFSDVEAYAKAHDDMRIDLSPALNPDLTPEEKQKAIAKLLQELPKTAIGIHAVDQASGLKNNLFLEDITKIIILQLAEQNFEKQIDHYLRTQAVSNSDGSYETKDILKAIDFVKNTDLGRKFDPNNEYYWGILNNPLIDISDVLGGNEQEGLNDGGVHDNGNLPEKTGGSGLSLSKVKPETISLVMSALMLKKDDTNNINNRSVITTNQLFFNKDKELLTYELPVANGNREQTGGAEITDAINLRMFDSTKNNFGVYENLLSHQGVSDQTYRQLGKDTLDDKTINGVIPYGIARSYKIKIGDTITLLSNTIHREEIKIKVIGINEDVSFNLGTGWPIDVDYNQFREKFFSNELNGFIDNDRPIFNKMYSQEQLLTGNINVNDIAGSINTMKFVGKNLSMSIDNNASIFASVFDGVIDFAKYFSIPVDNNFALITNPNVASSAKNSSVIPFNILRSGVDNIIGIINNVLTLFMVLVAFLLLIILVVVMNIVVEEASQIILTLRAIGYSSTEINWIVMGSYVIGALISFILAYILSIIIWVVFLEVVGNLTHIYVFMSFSWKAPVITFLVLGTILFIGWFAADHRVNKTPLTRITSFG